MAYFVEEISGEMTRILNVFGCCMLMCLPSTGREVAIVAHRGASNDAPENTLPAFRMAWQQGADAIEGDFHLTKDGKIVSLHDANTKKAAGVDLVVRETDLAGLRQLDVGSGHGEEFKGTLIPTISEVFATVPPEKKIYVEIKCGVEIIPPLLLEIEQSGLTQNQIVVISFKKEVIQEMKAQAPEYRAFWLCHFKEEKNGQIKPVLGDVLKTLETTRADGLSSSASIPKEVVVALQKKGYQWHVWTINDLAEAKRLLELGVQSITTDLPGKIRQGLGQDLTRVDRKVELTAMLGKKGSYEYNLVGRRLLRPIDDELLKQLVANPKASGDHGFILSTWLSRVAAEGDPKYRWLLDRDELRKNVETDDLLLAYDYKVNGNQEALKTLLDRLKKAMKKEGSWGTPHLFALAAVDEWDLSREALGSHPLSGDGAGGDERYGFWLKRRYFFPDNRDFPDDYRVFRREMNSLQANVFRMKSN